ncbi:MAG: tetratricopeptide repeat protein [Rhodospirillaceae bacterium]
MNEVVTLLGEGITRHQAGDLDAAEKIYRQVLDRQPGYADAIHLLGVIDFQRGRLTEAEALVTGAIAIDGKVAIYHANLGRIRMAQGRAEAAIVPYREAIGLTPDDAALHSDLAAALVTYEDFDGARSRARLAIDLDPNLAQAHLNLGLALRGLGGPSARGAAACFRRAAEIDPGLADAQQALGEALQATGDEDGALDCYRRAIHARPGMVEAHCNLGNILRERMDLDAALVQYAAALEYDPEIAAVHANQAVALHEKSRFEDALEAYARALAIAPNDPEIRRNRAMTLLLLGRFEDAWPEFEWRWKTARFQAERRKWKKPQWTADQLATDPDNTVLIHAEQGLGDMVQFIRYAHRLRDLGFHVAVECPRPLVRLIAAMPSVMQVVEKGDPLPSHDFHIPVMSLPGAFKTTSATIPGDVPYLTAPRPDVDRWRTALSELKGTKIGICWKGSPDHPRDRVRSPGLAAFLPLFNLPGASLVSLQKQGGEADLKARGVAGRLFDPTPDLPDLAAAAALIAGLDLVVTCDTAVAHLAGALGRPVALVLPHVAEWRWMAGRNDTPWYPAMRLFRQPAPGDWASAMDDVAAHIRRHRLR